MTNRRQMNDRAIDIMRWLRYKLVCTGDSWSHHSGLIYPAQVAKQKPVVMTPMKPNGPSHSFSARVPVVPQESTTDVESGAICIQTTSSTSMKNRAGSNPTKGRSLDSHPISTGKNSGKIADNNENK